MADRDPKLDAPAPDLEPVPRLPRKFFTRSMARDVWKIAFLAATLVAVLVLRKDCGEGVGNLFQSFEAPVDAGPASAPPTRYRRLTPEEIDRQFPREAPAGEGADAGAALR